MRYLFYLFLCFSLNLYAGELTDARKLTNIGCHKNDDTCWVMVEGTAVVPNNCKSTFIRWRKQQDVNGEAIFSHLTSAFFAGKKIMFYLSDGCFTPQPEYPTFNYYHIVN